MADNILMDNMSYTNADFQSVYNELLSIVPQLTNDWVPEKSNEADPGVVLIKLMAFLADKNNYNIDKTLLEHAPASTTIESNARQWYDLLGYKMHWYKSAFANLTYSYVGDFFDNPANQDFVIPAFTPICDDNSGIIFTLLGTDDTGITDIVVQGKNQKMNMFAVEGTIQDVTINGSLVVKASALDEQRRLYFQQKNIAENGIYVKNSNSSWGEWQQVDNLTSYALGNKIFEFGIKPNSDVCYIEFPEDIATLIEDGLNIKYVTSRGIDGNISAYKLTKFFSDVEIKNYDDTTSNLNAENSIISNADAAFGGVNPQTLDEAYIEYKKQVGTFNTLVSCQDYINFINRILQNNRKLISNNVVSDRTNDINNAQYIRSIAPEKDDNILVNSEMTAYNLGLYPLTKMDAVVNELTFNKSFTAAERNVNIGIQNEVADVKSVQHDFYPVTYDQNPEEEEEYLKPYIFKAFFGLDGKVTTYNKVSKTEQEDIENNIKKALMNAYSADKVEFGSKIDYDLMLNTIRNSDPRIKEVIVDEPEYEIRVLSNKDKIGTYDKATPITEHVEIADTYGSPAVHKHLDTSIIERNILAGNANYYNFDDRFNYQFGQTNVNIYNKVKSLTTNCNVPITTVSGKRVIDYTVMKNESINFYSPYLVTKASYQCYCRLYVKGGWGSTVVGDGENYVIPADGILSLTYEDANNETQTVEFKQGDIVCPHGFSISTSLLNEPYEAPTYYILGAKDSLDFKAINSLTLGTNNMGDTLYCYWIMQRKLNGADILYDPDVDTNGEITLKNGEYFIYTDASQTDLAILGAGTRLKFTYTPETVISNQAVVDTNDILEFGTSALKDYWYSWDLTATPGPITITENDIFTLTENMRFTCDVIDESAGSWDYVNHIPCSVTNIRYWEENATASDYTTVESRPDGYGWRILPRLDLAMAPMLTQTLENPIGWTDESVDHQSIEITYLDEDDDENRYTCPAGTSILANAILIESGGQNVITSVMDISGNISYDLSLLTYIYEEPTSTLRNANANNFRVLDTSNWKTFTNADTVTYGIKSTKEHAKDASFFVASDETVTITEYENDVAKRFYKYNKDIYIKLDLSTDLQANVETTLSSTNSIVISGCRLPFDLGRQLILPIIDQDADCSYTVTVGEDYVTEDLYTGTTGEGFTLFSGTYMEKIYKSDPSVTTSQYIIIVKADDDDTPNGLLLLGKLSLNETISNYVPEDLAEEIEDMIAWDCSNATRKGVANISAPFNYTYRLDDSIKIESENLLSAEAFFDPHNQFNRWTIPQLRTDKINIKVATSSRK